MKITLILFTLFFGACALRRAPSDEFKFKLSKCPQQASADMWGVWIDGRDANKNRDGGATGPSAYGLNYELSVLPALQYAYDAAQNGTDLDFEVFDKVARKVRSFKIGKGNPYRTLYSPIMGDVKPCHKAMPKAEVDKIFATVTVIDRKYQPADAVKYKPVLNELFSKYTSEVSSNAGRNEEILALAKLVQNIAFLHPLGDANGRSRLVLMNYLLRRRGIACGTMMWNNNKNVYFETADQIANHIKEGIVQYDIALATDFKVNPWQNEEVRTKHQAQEKPAWSDDVERCFQSKIGGGARGTSALGFKDARTDDS